MYTSKELERFVKMSSAMREKTSLETIEEIEEFIDKLIYPQTNPGEDNVCK